MLGELCLGTVHHHRLRPREHRFDYGVYYLRLPLRALAVTGWSSRLLSYNHRNLLSIHDADHGDGVTPMLDWVNTLLTKQGIHDADGEIWLQTFPRVLGYVFNPVSFWFCQRQDGSLRAVLCEVNNTFGERHLYLLDISDHAGAALQAKKSFMYPRFFRSKANTVLISSRVPSVKTHCISRASTTTMRRVYCCTPTYAAILTR